MKLSLLDDLGTGEYDTALFLTYTLNLRFFEQLVLPRLHKMGVARIGILVDIRGYQQSFHDPLGQEKCGQEYIVAPILLERGGIQHAKLLWLEGKEQVAYVGSHNLTMAGYNDQVEITTKLSSKHAGHLHALRSIYDAVSRVIPPPLQYVWTHIHQPPDSSSVPTAKLLTSLDHPLIEQMSEWVGKAEELRVVTPFLDMPTLATLARRVKARKITLDVPYHGPSTTEPLIHAISAIPSLQLRRFNPQLDKALHQSRLHAKVYAFHSSGAFWLALGSANCTQAALAKSVAQGGNLEFLLALEGAGLDEEELPFTSTDPDKFSDNGNPWPESLPFTSSIFIKQAEYKAGQLVVHWVQRSGKVVDDLCVDVNGVEIPCLTNPFVIDCPLPPRIVTIKGTVKGQEVITQAWVADWKTLEEHITQIKSRRWVTSLTSENPLHHAESIVAFLDQSVRQLIHANGEMLESQTKESANSFRPKEETRHNIKHLVETFTFSPDPVQLRISAETLMEGPAQRDPLALLRALIARHAATPPVTVENDPQEVERERYENRKRQARQQIVEKLINHLKQLQRLDHAWMKAPNHHVVLCLRVTFGAVALIGYHIAQYAIPSARVRLVEEYLLFLEQLIIIPNVSSLVAEIEVAGPLGLSLGAMAAVAGLEQTYEDRLARLARRLFGDDVRPILRQWGEQFKNHAEILLMDARGGDLSTRWEPPLLRLFRIPPDYIKQKQHYKWGTLLALHQADSIHSPERDELYTRAANEYASLPIWTSYITARRRGNFPIVFQISTFRCNKCFREFAEQQKRALMRGDAVTCCGRIFLLKT